MTAILIQKLLRDIRLSFLAVAALLAAYQCLWVKISERISGQLMPKLMELATVAMVSPEEIENTIFGGPGKVIKTLIGGEHISLFNTFDMLTVGYVHPLTQTILCIWAIGRAAGAIAGEVDRGTMELLLAQPLARFRIVLAHLCVDAVTIPLLCLSIWGGTWLGTSLVGLREAQGLAGQPGALINPSRFLPGLWNIGALLLAISGATMWLSARGRFRWRVLGTAVLLILLQFLVNLVGQLWDAVAVLRPLTVFYYYQPQQIILQDHWSVDVGACWNDGQPLASLNIIAVLVSVGFIGYGLALWTFCRRDLPAPL